MDTCPSGCQVEITYDDQRTTAVGVAGGIRRCEVGGRSVFDPYPIDTMCDCANRAPLIPWPSRLADGQHRVDGVQSQVTCTQPEKYDAIEGLLRWRAWQVMRTSTTGVAAVPLAQAGTTTCPQGSVWSTGADCTSWLAPALSPTTNTSYPPAPERSNAPPTTPASHAFPGLQRWTAPSLTSSVAQLAEPGLASGEPMTDEQSSGLTRAARPSGSTPATPSHPIRDGRASALSR